MLLVFAMVFGMYTFTIPGFASPDGGLNGSSGKWSEFDHSIYDTEATAGDFRASYFEWPSNGTLLVIESATSSSFTIAKFNGITIPAGLVVDFYKYDGTGDTYTLLGHFDTTDGNPVTIGSGNSGNSTANTPSVTNNTPSVADKPSTPSSTSNSGDFGKVLRTFTPSTPSASYSKSYDDVTPDLWCYDAIMTMTEGGLLGGYGNGKFGPNDALTRAQLAIINMRMGGSTITDGFEETKFDGYAVYKDRAVATRAWAAIALVGRMPEDGYVALTPYELSLVETKGKSILTGYGTYGKNSAGSMTWALYDIWRASLSKNLTYRASIDEFPDAAEIHKWIDENADLISNYLIIRGSHEHKVQMCETYFLRAYNLGMFRGVDSQGTFNPYGSITRGQLCQALYNVGWTYAKCLGYTQFYK